MPVSHLKSDFPIFSNTPHVYLDSAATTHKPQAVIDAIARFYSHDYGTIRRGLYGLSSGATRLFEESREQVADFIGASSPNEIVFTSGATDSINLVACAYLRPLLQPGDEIIVSTLEHHANFIPWQQIAAESQAQLIVLPLDDGVEIELSQYRQHLNPRTRIVAIGHISNVTGGINPVKEIVNLAHLNGTKVLIDGAQSIAHIPVNVRELDCDFYVFSGHKIYGPTGIGVLYGKEDLLNEMPPYRFGGEMILEVTNEYSNFKKSPQRFEAGTPNIAGVIGLSAAIRYFRNLTWDQVMEREDQLLRYLISELQKERVTLVGKPHQRASLVSFLLDDIHPHDVGTLLDDLGIAVRAGHHCAQPLMRYLKIPATVRVSLGCYNDQPDIEALIRGLRQVRKIMR